MVYNNEGRVSLENPNNLGKRTTGNIGSKGSGKIIISSDTLNLDNLYYETTKLGSKGSDIIVSDKSNLESSNYL